MVDLLLCALFFVILLVPCALAMRSASGSDLHKEDEPEGAAEAASAPLTRVSGLRLHPINRTLSEQGGLESQDAGHLSDDHERELKRLADLCSPSRRVA